MNKGSRSTLLVAVLCILVGIAIIAVAVALTPGGFSKIWKDAVNTNYMDKLENIGVSVPGGSKNWKNAYSPDGKYTVTESVSGIDIERILLSPKQRIRRSPRILLSDGASRKGYLAYST